MNITFTGIDEYTELENLQEFDAEFGILYSATPNGRNRYPSKEWIAGAVERVSNAAIHVCGTRARAELLEGSLPFLSYVKRIQVNGILTLEECEFLCREYPNHTIITQHTERNKELLAVRNGNHSVLIDGSGGRGVLPTSWNAPDTDKLVGFAGGLGPENICEQFSRIIEQAKSGYWLDMESKLRDSEDKFSIEKVKEVLNNINARLIYGN